jgi:tetratricopeptide (TPR) repeat protein
MAHRFDLSIFLQWRGDQVAWRRANESVLERFGGTTEPFTARLVAGLCVQAADGAANMDALVRLAKLALEGNTVPSMKPSYLNTMGAALYRAGRFQEAIPFLDEAVSINGPTGQPLDAAYLAMAHERLGHHAEALRWLEYLRGHQASAEPALFWNELQVQYHLIEAEAVVVYDPVFPADVFAH